LRIAFINPVVEKPGKHKLHFQLYKLNDVFKCILDLKIPEIFLSSVFVVCFAIQKWILSNWEKINLDIFLGVWSVSCWAGRCVIMYGKGQYS